MQNVKNRSIKWWVNLVSYTTLFIIIGIFAYSKMDFLMHGVDITAQINHEDASPIVKVTGVAENAIHLSLNGREIFIDKDGSFKEPVALLPGLSVVTLNAEDKFGKTSEKKFEVMYEENTGIAVVSKNKNIN